MFQLLHLSKLVNQELSFQQAELNMLTYVHEMWVKIKKESHEMLQILVEVHCAPQKDAPTWFPLYKA